MEQRSDEWFTARRGMITASKIKKELLAKKTTKAYQDFRTKCLVYRLGESDLDSEAREQGFLSKEVQRGIELEPEARQQYEFMTDVDVIEPGFIKHPTLPYCGASPDGLVGEDGLIEIKCRNLTAHVDFLINRTIPSEYMYQMQFQMMCTGRKWCDYVSYDNRVSLFPSIDWQRVYPNPDMIEEITAAVHEFNSDVDQLKAAFEEKAKGWNQW